MVYAIYADRHRRRRRRNGTRNTHALVDHRIHNHQIVPIHRDSIPLLYPDDSRRCCVSCCCCCSGGGAPQNQQPLHLSIQHSFSKPHYDHHAVHLPARAAGGARGRGDRDADPPCVPCAGQGKKSSLPI